MNSANAPAKAMNGSITKRLGKWWKPIAFAVILAAGLYFALIFPWGKWPPAGAGPWPAWETEPTKDANIQVLTTLLAQNRDEVRFWQGVLFNVSLVFIGGVLGILSLA